jgi:hypothetical protein
MTRSPLNRPKVDKAKKALNRDKFQKLMFDNPLELPRSMLLRAQEENISYRWIRVRDGSGKDDMGNIMKWRNLGYTFVSPEEAPELSLGYVSEDHNRYGNLITVGSLALAKIDTDERQEIIEAKEAHTRRMSQGIMDQVRARGVDTKGSTSAVSKGKGREAAIAEYEESED